MAAKREWMVSGDCPEACTSPAVCPYYWGSSTPRDLHEDKNQCEGAFTFHIKKGYHGKTVLDVLSISEMGHFLNRTLFDNQAALADSRRVCRAAGAGWGDLPG